MNLKMRSPTKKELQEELRAHNIPLPSPNAKKEVFLSLYRQFVLSNSESGSSTPSSASSTAGSSVSNKDFAAEVVESVRNGTEFSSDEENSPILERKRFPSVLKETMRIEPESFAEIQLLDDDELFKALKDKGVDVGPIVGTTRKFYERKLLRLIEGDVDMNENEFSDGDDILVVDSPPREQFTQTMHEQSVHYSSETQQKRFETTKVSSEVRHRATAAVDGDFVSKVVDQVQEPLPNPAAKNTSSHSGFGLALVLKFIAVIVSVLLLILVYINMEDSEMNQIPLN